MNENIDLTKILKDCPKGTKLYSPIAGDVILQCIENSPYPIYTRSLGDLCDTFTFTKEGKYFDRKGECLLFPSKDQRDWSKWKCPNPKNTKFDPKTLKAFDRVLVRTEGYNLWSIDLFSFIGDKDFKCIGGYFKSCIPYNEDTKHLVGTKEEAPEYYRYWED